ncbi:hypothetical protein [Luteolibacter soli]|uniref:Uncharacterized protein n=1 Tax=Luteolibacter soli TaxID=3135280 RepID=A0ABU9AV92_9BACT
MIPPDPTWRKAEPRLGPARINDYVGRLRPGIVVKVLELKENDLVARVESDWGLARQLFTHHLDFGYEFRTKSGHWIPEHDPRALRWLRRVLDELHAGKPQRHLSDDGLKLDLPVIEKLLRRNGHPAPPPPKRRRY